MQERRQEPPSTPLAATPESPASRSIRRVGLMQAVLEVMATPIRQRPAPKAEPKEAPKPINRHERRKAAALARRGR